MEEITGIKKSDLTADEHFQLHTEAIALMERTGVEALKIQAQYDKIMTAYKMEDEALKKIAKSALTQDVKMEDKNRDTTLAGMNDKLKAALKHFDPEVKKAAENVKILFDTYGRMATLPLYQQTSAVFNFLQELRGKYAQDAKKIEIDQWADQLETANNRVEELMRERRDENVDKQTEASFKQARKMVDEAYSDITKRVNALALVEGEENYAEFIRAMNALMKDFKDRVSQRKGRAAAKNKE